MTEDIEDIEQFIEEVKIRPIVWDADHEDYKDRVKKQSAWESICEALVENFSNKNSQEKHKIIKRLALKWKNVKDNYARSLRKRAKSGPGEKSVHRKYIYSKQLSFLKVSMAMATSQPTPVNPEKIDSLHSRSQRDEEEDGFLSESATLPDVIYDSKIPSTSPSTAEVSSESKWRRTFESALLNFINTPTVVEPPDEDKSFFDSLIPTIKSFNQDQKLDFRSDVLDVVKRIKRQNQTLVPSMIPQNKPPQSSSSQCTASDFMLSLMSATSSLPSSTTSATSSDKHVTS